MTDELFAGMRPVRPGGEVKRTVLQAARAATRAHAAPERRDHRLSRFDVAWSAALLVLVVCHALLSLSRRPSAVAEGSSPSIAEKTKLEKELGLNEVPMVVAGRDAAGRRNAEAAETGTGAPVSGGAPIGGRI